MVVTSPIGEPRARLKSTFALRRGSLRARRHAVAQLLKQAVARSRTCALCHTAAWPIAKLLDWALGEHRTVSTPSVNHYKKHETLEKGSASKTYAH